MSLSAWEQQALDSIKDGLAGSDPQLSALLTTFTRLASGEEMPVQEDIVAGSRRKPHHRRRVGASPRSRPMPGYVGTQWVILALLFVITGTLITVAFVLSHSDGGQGTCTGFWAPVCSRSVPG
jgi:hypothetical protein